MNKLVSIVIPIFDCEKYLKRCVNSLISQTYSNIEIILVDDGSKDKSGKIADDLANEYQIVNSFHKINGGVSSARNFGISKANGEFIIFVDADDFVARNFVKSIIPTDADLGIIEYLQVDEDSTIFHEIEDTSEKEEIINQESVLNGLLDINNISGYVWNKCFKLSIINRYNIRFDEKAKMNEDLLFCVEYCLHINKARYSHNKCYYYYINSFSITNNEYSYYEDTQLIALQKILEKTKRFERFNRKIADDYANLYVSICFRNRKKYLKDFSTAMEHRKNIRRINGKLTFKHKIMYMLLI